MPHNKRGHAVAKQYYPYKLLFYPSVLNRGTLHPNHLLSSLHPYSRHVCSSSPRLSMFGVGWGGGSGVGRHCGRSGTVKPLSFHAPLALMCTHAGRLLKAIQTASWWDHSWFLSHVLTPQTLCPLLSSKTNNVGDIFFLKSSVKVRPASGNHGLTSVTAVECRSEFIWWFKKDNTSNLNVTRSAKSFLNFFFFHPGFHIINWSIIHVFTPDTHRTGLWDQYRHIYPVFPVKTCESGILSWIVSRLLLEAHSLSVCKTMMQSSTQ